MKIHQWKIERVRPYENNPRCNDQAVDKVAASIREFGFRQPIVVNGEGIIVAGHTRYKAALKIGLEKVPVHIASELTPEQIKAYRIVDNKTNEIAEWDSDLLKMEFDDLMELEYSIENLGFDMEVDFYGGDDEEHNADNEEQDPDIPEIEISEKLSLERLTIFVEEHLKKEVLRQIRDITSKYDEGLVRIVT